jgi:prolyl-tRNA synthetase
MDAACVALVPQEGPLPLSFAPFKVSVVVASMKNGDAVAAAEKIADELEKSGADVLHDERDERAGVKFSDAELIGFPAVVVCGRDASEGKVELRLPGKGNELVAIDDVCSRLIEFLSA